MILYRHMTTTLTGQNQITIPAKLAKRYSLKPGSRLEWKPGRSGDEIICRVLPEPALLASELRGAGKKYLKEGSRHPLEILEQERELE
jgi:bifunctional DNA-binding transcriptional regulator/antitoxin component of YhaV-PrlF toxin-antitoxin module